MVLELNHPTLSYSVYHTSLNDRYLQNGNIFPIIVQINTPIVVVNSQCRYIKIKAREIPSVPG